MKEKLPFYGAIFDMDGVITQTATIHAKAWKLLFDEFLQGQEGKVHPPFDIDQDYKRYIDGKPRLEGIRSFLNSREIFLEEGNPTAEASFHTVHGLGKRKNNLFQQFLEKEGAEVFKDTIEVVKRWKGDMKLAVISSSKNCKPIMETAGILDLFDVRVDGITSGEKHLKGKPEPDIFLEASKQMGIEPSHCLIFEDAIAGVEAGKKGGFGLVIGVARDGQTKDLINSGADFVVESLENIDAKILNYA